MLKRTLLFAALHVLVSLGLLFIIIAFSGDSDAEPQRVIRFAMSLLEILWLPGAWIHEAFNTSGNDFIEWALLATTSLLWGLMFASFKKPRGARV